MHATVDNYNSFDSLDNNLDSINTAYSISRLDTVDSLKSFAYHLDSFNSFDSLDNNFDVLNTDDSISRLDSFKCLDNFDKVNKSSFAYLDSSDNLDSTDQSTASSSRQNRQS